MLLKIFTGILGRRFIGFALSLIPLLFVAGTAFSATDIASNAEIVADEKSLNGILITFQEAEKSLQKEHLPGIMRIYSGNYENRGINKPTLKAIWQDIFARYDRLSSRHLFSKIIVDKEKGTAQVTCTGALFGASILNKEGALSIDHWFEAVHYLTWEKGGWKIIGHDPAGGASGFGSAIHLLF